MWTVSLQMGSIFILLQRVVFQEIPADFILQKGVL